MKISYIVNCFRKNQLRLQYSDNEIRFLPGDHTRNPAPNSYCKRKMKHFYNGDLYDNMHMYTLTT